MRTLPLEKPFSRTQGDPVSAALKLQARERIAHYVELAQAAWPSLKASLQMPSCSFDLRGARAGRASSKRLGTEIVGHVQLNGHLLSTQSAEMFSRVIPREVAHLATFCMYGEKAELHGVEWHRVMRSLGQEPDQTPALVSKPARVVPRPYLYRCACQDHWLTAQRHKKTYQCKQCGELLVFIRGPQGELGKSPSLQLVRPAPLRPPVAAVMTPTQKQLEFALSLSNKTGVNIPEQCLTDRKALSAWIESMAPKARRPQ